MSWSPDAANVEQLAQLLLATTNPRDQTKLRQAEIALKEFRNNQDATNYLTFITVQPAATKDLSARDHVSVRSAAGIMLKNQVKTSWKSLPEGHKDFVKSHILRGLQDTNAPVRRCAGLVITEIVTQGGLLSWTQVLTELVAIVQSPETSAQAQDGAMGALYKICEDNKKALNKNYNGERPVDALVPKLVEFSDHSQATVRWQALAALNIFMTDYVPEAIQINAELILQHLIQRAQDDDASVRRYVCRLLTSLTSTFPELMEPHLDGIVDYILQQQRSDPDSLLALEAAEFFFENSEKPELHQAFAATLPKIVPVLLQSMRYGEEAQARLEAEAEEDAEEEDKEQDIKPQFATTKHEKGQNANAGGAASNGGAEDDDDSDGEIVEDDADADPEDQWSLRKCSAASLDYFSANYSELVFNSTLPYLRENLSHAAWPHREAAVLTLGAIAEGCMPLVQPHLHELVPYLITLLNDPTPVVRMITCWTLGRYSGWAAELDEENKKKFFEPMMEGMLHRMLDKNKKVQKAAIAGFANLEGHAQENLIPYGPVIAQQFAKCFEQYKDANMYYLYDCVQMLSTALGSEMASPQMVNLLMPAILTRWQLVQDESKEMFPLLECLSYLATSMREGFAQFAEPLFSRCIRIVKSNLEEGNATVDRPTIEQPDKDFLVTSLDLLSAIIQSLDEQTSTKLVKESRPNLFELLSYCMRDTSNDVRQSAYALLGDCAIYVFAQLRPYLDPLLRILMLQLDLDTIKDSYPAKDDREAAYRVVNNASWSSGEITMRAGEEIAPHLDQLFSKLATVMFAPKIPHSLHENAATAIGRLGIVFPQVLAPQLRHIAPTFLAVMARVQWTEEKAHGLQGFTNAVTREPQGLEECLIPYLTEVATGMLHSFAPPNGFQELLEKYQAMIGDFSTFLSNVPPAQLQVLQQTYNIR